VQTQVQPTAGYSMYCLRYIVNGTFSVLVLNPNSTSQYRSGEASSTAVVMSGCGSWYIAVLDVDMTTIASAGTGVVLGYTIEYMQGLLPLRLGLHLGSYTFMMCMCCMQRQVHFLPGWPPGKAVEFRQLQLISRVSACEYSCR
jgi:hypothetical protein